MKKRIAQFACIFILLLVIPGVLLWGWQAKNRCQAPFLSVVPSPMPKDISGLLALIESHRSAGRNLPAWWELKAELPLSTSDSTDTVREIAVQGQNIWLAHSSFIQRYDTDSGERFTYQVLDDGNAIKWVEHIMVTQVGDVWAVVRLDASLALVYFDAKKDAFRIVRDRDDLFSNWKDDRFFDVGSNLEETSEGKILISFQKNILVYAPQTNIAQLLLPETFGFAVNSLAVSNNNLWFTVDNTSDLWNMDLTNKTIQNYGPAPEEYDGPIAVDRMGRVWLGYFTRLEPDMNGQYHWWQPKSYPPEFIYLDSPYEDSLSGNGELQYLWSGVETVFIASDDSIWFSASSGIVKYDMDRGDWCLSASVYPNSIAEDNSGSLWMVPSDPRDQGLYKYTLKP